MIIQAEFRRFRRGPLDEAIEVDFVFGFKPPESWSAKKKARAIAGELRHVTKPDTSNLVKMYEDAMNGVVYRDDSQIDRIAGAKKVYAEQDFTRIDIRTDVAYIVQEPPEKAISWP
jgi:Holliday junction resolvase RusA-like endonuclease